MNIGAVILAAGGGTRMGGVAKALLRHGQRSYLQCIVDAIAPDDTGARGDLVVVVGPPFGDAVAAHARELGLSVVDNPAPERGMASSVALGFAALVETSAVNAAWLWPVDHPDVRVETLHAIANALGTHDACIPRHAGRGGHPPLVARRLWPALAACTDSPQGARSVLAACDAVTVEVADPGVIRDVDTPADARALA